MTILRLLILTSLVTLITGCQTIDYSDYLNNYEKNYIKHTPYKIINIKRESFNIHSREFGDHPAEDTPIIAAHGFPDSLHLYDEIATIISKKRKFISFDFIGWGRSDKPDKNENQYDTRSLYKDLDAVINYYTDDKVILIAHDISAFPVIDWALDNPERIEKLVILNSVYFRSKTLVPPEAIGRFSENSLKRDLLVFGANINDAAWQTGLIEQTSKFFYKEQARKKYVPIFAQQCFDIRPAFFSLNKVLREEVSSRNERINEMKEFEPRALILFGSKDPYLNSDVAREFADVFPNSLLKLVDDGGHYVQLDSPGIVSQLIMEEGN